MNTQIRIGIVEDEPMAQQYLERIIRDSPLLALDFMTSTFDGLKNYLTKYYNPHILLLDITLEGQKTDGKQIALYLKEYFPQIKVIIISNNYNNTIIDALREYGVKSYLPKRIIHPDLVEEIIELVYESDDYIELPRKMRPILSPIFIDGIKLSATKLEILTYLCQPPGLRMVEIAEKMGIAEITVQTNMKALRTKLGVNTNEAVVYKLLSMGAKF